MPQVGHGTFMQLLGVKTAAGTHLLLRQSTALIREIRMTFNLGLDGSPPQHVMGMVVRPCEKFSCCTLAPLQNIA